MNSDWYTARELGDACEPKLTKHRIIQLIKSDEIEGELAPGMFGVKYWRVEKSEGDRFIEWYKKNRK